MSNSLTHAFSIALAELKRTTAERDRARDVAVALEQEVADLRERLEFATWGMS